MDLMIVLDFEMLRIEWVDVISVFLVIFKVIVVVSI